ncbi:MAG: orotidine-5'-phosphate decarboxylase [Sandaracinus sp.]|nr:orotidine-5'-phosphate decarboxylase [Sandaracinus sp.]MCB9612269.1 orotidine-5'-phosphate decarboxylase [Sandaracinus sp.]
MQPKDRLVFPLDVPDLETAKTWITRLAGEVGVLKVGLELFTAAGPDAVRAVHDAGAKCFLDLKLHDISATMASAVRAASRLGVEYLTVHAVAAPAALDAVREAAAGTSTRLLAVTVLTSLDASQLDAIGLQGPPAAAVERLARLATSHGLDGLVCSPEECATLRHTLGDDVLLVVPGIRPEGSARGDQARVATPANARRDGADLLVVGRPIRNAEDPVAAARAIVAEIAGVSA